MDSELRILATDLLAAAPASVEMPAGTGKTHLLAASVALAADKGHRALILTHTNAGVDAIRKRLRSFGVAANAARVDTIDGWAFSLTISYSELAGIAVGDAPEWSMSGEYIEGATKVAGSAAIRDMHGISFDYLFVDEYQDCTLTQHTFVRKVAEAIPQTVLFGDPLQAIFGFAGELADWKTHVLPEFPSFLVAPKPQRWKGHNEDLGSWLLDIRSALIEGKYLDFSRYDVPGLQLITDISPARVAAVARGFKNYSESVVLLDKWPRGVATHASRLGGSYSVMEDLGGNFMREQISGSNAGKKSEILPLPSSGDSALARWLAQFAKACVIGLAEINKPILGRLERNQSLDGLTRKSIQPVVEALEQLRANPTYSQLLVAAHAIRSTSQVHVYRWEAWNDMLSAIEMTFENKEPAIDNLSRVRERLRQNGRRDYARIASRTLLVKGLEYDHVIIANLNEFCDPRNLYVALSRARKSITIHGSSARVQLQHD